MKGVALGVSLPIGPFPGAGQGGRLIFNAPGTYETEERERQQERDWSHGRRLFPGICRWMRSSPFNTGMITP